MLNLERAEHHVPATQVVLQQKKIKPPETPESVPTSELYYVGYPDPFDTSYFYRLEAGSWVLKGSYPNTDSGYMFIARGAEVAFLTFNNGSGENTLHLSEDYGTTWADKAMPEDANGWSAALGLDYEGNYYANVQNASEDGYNLYRSTDQGDSWALLLADHSYSSYYYPGPNGSVGDMVFKSDDPDFIALAGGSVGVSTNGGASFTDYVVGSGFGYVLILNGALVYVWEEVPSLNVQEYYASVFDGATWSTPVLIFTFGPAAGAVHFIAFSDGATIFLKYSKASTTEKFFTSQDAVTWDEEAPPDTFRSPNRSIAVVGSTRYAIDDASSFWVYSGSWAEDAAVTATSPSNVFPTDQGKGQ